MKIILMVSVAIRGCVPHKISSQYEDVDQKYGKCDKKDDFYHPSSIEGHLQISRCFLIDAMDQFYHEQGGGWRIGRKWFLRVRYHTKLHRVWNRIRLHRIQFLEQYPPKTTAMEIWPTFVKERYWSTGYFSINNHGVPYVFNSRKKIIFMRTIW